MKTQKLTILVSCSGLAIACKEGGDDGPAEGGIGSANGSDTEAGTGGETGDGEGENGPGNGPGPDDTGPGDDGMTGGLPNYDVGAGGANFCMLRFDPGRIRTSNASGS